MFNSCNSLAVCMQHTTDNITTYVVLHPNAFKSGVVLFDTRTSKDHVLSEKIGLFIYNNLNLCEHEMVRSLIVGLMVECSVKKLQGGDLLWLLSTTDPLRSQCKVLDLR